MSKKTILTKVFMLILIAASGVSFTCPRAKADSGYLELTVLGRCLAGAVAGSGAATIAGILTKNPVSKLSSAGAMLGCGGAALLPGNVHAQTLTSSGSPGVTSLSVPAQGPSKLSSTGTPATSDGAELLR